MKRKSLLLTLLMAFMVPLAMIGQETLTVHDGTATSGYVPVYGYYADAYLKCEMVYPAAELGDMEAGTITGMTFYATSPASGSWGSANFRVFLTEVANATISAYVGPGTVVYEGALDGTQSEMTITFTTPYVYNGGNLLVGVYNTVDGDYKSITWAGETVSGASVQGYSYTSLDDVSATQRNFLPKTTFGYTPSAPATCDKPTNFVVSYEGSIATATWDGEASLYNIDVNGDVTNGVTSPYTFAVEPQTTYTVKVQADCGGGDLSFWTVFPSFTTPCAAYALPYEYGFEDASDMTCWSMVDCAASTGISTSASYVHEGSAAFCFVYNTNPPQYLISPMFEGTGTGLSVSFYYMNPSTSYTEIFQVGYSTTTNETSAFTWGTEITASNANANTWFIYENDFPAGTKYVAVKLNSNDQLRLCLDDFTFEVPSSCRKPTNLAVADITASTATLSWTENGEATAWQVEVTDLDGGQVTTWDATTNPYQIVGLFEDTPYSVRVNPVCDVEKWSDPITFRTPELCPRPTNVAASDVTPMSANVSWTGTASSYNLRYRTARGFHYDFETATPWVEDNFAPCTTYDGDGLTTYQITDWTPLGTYQFVGSMMTLQSGVTDFASAHGGELFGGFVAGIPADDVEHNDDYFILPSITIEDGYVFEFWASSLLDNWGLERMRVGVYGGNGTITEYLAGSATDYVEVPNGWTKYSYDLSGFAGQTIQLAINSLCPDAYILGIDDIFVGDPTDDTWDVTLNDVTSPYALTGLTEETMYEVQVQAACGEDGESAWVGITFTTPSNCDAPSALEATDVMPHSATLNWTGYQDGYNIQYRTAEHRETYYFTNFNDGYNVAQEEGWSWEGNIIYGFEDPIYNIPASDNYFLQMGWATTEETYIFSPELPAYASGATLEFYYFGYSVDNTFQVGYSTTTNDADAFTWSDPIQAPLQDYTLFSEMLADGIKYVAFKATASENGATIFIDDFGIFGDIVPAGEWKTLSNVTYPYILENLEDDTEYEWQVQGINASCDGGVTEWSEIATFTTLNACADITDLMLDDLTATSMTLSWTGVQDSYLVQYRTAEGMTPKYFYDPANEQGDWTTDNLETNSGWETFSGYFTFYYTTNPPQTLISPELTDIPSNSTLAFDYVAYDAEYPETFKVGFSTTDNSVESFTWGDEVTATNADDFLTYMVSVPDDAKYFAIQCTSDDQYALILDDFAIGAEYAEAGEWNYITVTEPTVTIDGLDGLTTYDVYVQGICGEDEYTAQVGGQVTTPKLTTITETIELNTGINWVSFYVETTLDDLKAALLSALNNASGIKITSQSNGYTNWNGRSWRGSLSPFNVNQMFIIEVPADCEITLSAMPLDPAAHPLTIVNGPNWIGYPLASSMSVSAAFDGFAANGDKVTSLSAGFSSFNGRAWRGALSNLMPGQGYKYEVTTSGERTLVFPSASKAFHQGTSYTISNHVFNMPANVKIQKEATAKQQSVPVKALPVNRNCKSIKNIQK